MGCQPFTGPKACCGLFGPDLHGLYHGATAGVQLRRKYGIVETVSQEPDSSVPVCCQCGESECGIICRSTCCPVCAIKHDHNIMLALKEHGVKPQRQRMDQFP